MEILQVTIHRRLENVWSCDRGSGAQWLRCLLGQSKDLGWGFFCVNNMKSFFSAGRIESAPSAPSPFRVLHADGFSGAGRECPHLSLPHHSAAFYVPRKPLKHRIHPVSVPRWSYNFSQVNTDQIKSATGEQKLSI